MHEVGEKRHSGSLAFLWMKLNSEDVGLDQHGGEIQPVVGHAQHVGVMHRARPVAVNKVEPGILRDAFEQRVFARMSHLVPAHMRDLDAIRPLILRPRFGKCLHRALEQAQGIGTAILV